MLFVLQKKKTALITAEPNKYDKKKNEIVITKKVIINKLNYIMKVIEMKVIMNKKNNIMKKIEKNCQNKHKINIENHIMKNRINERIHKSMQYKKVYKISNIMQKKDLMAN